MLLLFQGTESYSAVKYLIRAGSLSPAICSPQHEDLWHYVIPKERNGFSHICFGKKVSKVYIALKECNKLLEPQIWIFAVTFSYRQK